MCISPCLYSHLSQVCVYETDSSTAVLPVSCQPFMNLHKYGAGPPVPGHAKVTNKKYGLQAIQEKRSIAVNAFWQSTATAAGPQQRSKKAACKTSLVKALYDQVQRNSGDAGSASQEAAMSPAAPENPKKAAPAVLPAPAELPMFPWESGEDNVLRYACRQDAVLFRLDEQVTLCAVSKEILGLMPPQPKNVLDFERRVMKFAWTPFVGSLLDREQLCASQKMLVVSAMYSYMKCARANEAPTIKTNRSSGVRAWGLATLYIAASMSALSAEHTEAVRQAVVQARLGSGGRDRLRSQAQVLLNRLGGLAGRLRGDAFRY